jgi:ribosome-binding protein aMBF1 (putative translation factor)
MGAGAAFDNHLDEQLADPVFREHYERRLANLQGFLELLRAIDRAREARDLSKKAVADRMGRHPSAVSRLLSGDGPNPTLETIAELAEAVDLQITIHVKPRPKRGSKNSPAVAVTSAV